MGVIEWGENPEFFGPRHAHREQRLVRALEANASASGLHLECAAGLGSLSAALATGQRTVVAADTSLRSLNHLQATRTSSDRILPVVADIRALPFADESFSSASTAETLEHIDDDAQAVRELSRVLEPECCLVGTVPADPGQWSDWDVWGGHLRRYTAGAMTTMLEGAGLEATVMVWGWPILRSYDALFLRRINRRRLHHDLPIEHDPSLRRVSALGRRRWLVRLVSVIFDIDRLFDGAPWGVGLLFTARKMQRR
jgi:SAM-dependent methyltransferase